MMMPSRVRRGFFVLCAVALGLGLCPGKSAADPSRYPKYAQQQLPPDIVPDFVFLDQFVEEVVSGKKPLIIDVRDDDEYDEVHIKAAVSIPLGEISMRLNEIPRDRPVVLY